MWPYSSILMCYWLACDLIPAFWCVIASDVASSQHTNVLLIIMWPHSSILMWPNSSILKYYWFLWYLNPGTDVLLILMWPLSSMLMCYWLSCDLIPAYWCVIDSHVTSFQHTGVLLILRLPHSSILMGDFQKNEDFSFSDNNLNIKWYERKVNILKQAQW